ETAPTERLLIIRPLRNFLEGHRHVVGLRNLRDGSGAIIPAGPAFAGQRDAYTPGNDHVIDPLVAEGVRPEELFLAWDFTTISEQSLAGRALGIRDQAFALLGDTNLADGVVEGVSPGFTVTSVQ